MPTRNLLRSASCQMASAHAHVRRIALQPAEKMVLENDWYHSLNYWLYDLYDVFEGPIHIGSTSYSNTFDSTWVYTI